jgi:plastocyanin
MKNFIFLLLFLLTGLYTNATTFIVSVTNFQFSPSNIPNVLVGDVIQFNFAAVNFHNATSMPLGSVPAGAAAIFSGTPGSVTTSYSYTVTRAGSYRYYCANHSLDGVTGMVGTFTASGIVPVTLKNFEVVCSNRVVTATWQTASEENLAYFSLQKSTDGKNYVEAGRVNAIQNTGTLQSYSYKDERVDMTARYIYYMLKTVNADGSFSFSPVRLVRNDQAIKKLITQMGPNPVTKAVGHLMFRFNADRNSSMKALVLDANGKTVMSLELSANKGINNGHIHMGDQPPGIYTVIFSLDGLKETRKVVVEE